MSNPTDDGPGAGEPLPNPFEIPDEDDAGPRFWVTSSLTGAGPVAEDALPALIEAMEGPDAPVRAAAVRVVEKLGPSAGAAVAPLVEILRRGGDPSVRQYAVRALGAIGTPEAVEGLIDLLRDPGEALRWAAVVQLKQIGPAARAAAPVLAVIAAEGQDPKLRAQAESALKLIRDE